MIVVLFSTVPRDDLDLEDYQRASARMRDLVAAGPGFTSYNTYRAEDGESITIARFASEDALNAWRFHREHRQVQHRARYSYYQQYWVQACATLREYRFHSTAPATNATCGHRSRGLRDQACAIAVITAVAPPEPGRSSTKWPSAANIADHGRQRREITLAKPPG